MHGADAIDADSVDGRQPSGRWAARSKPGGPLGVLACGSAQVHWQPHGGVCAEALDEHDKSVECGGSPTYYHSNGTGDPRTIHYLLCPRALPTKREPRAHSCAPESPQREQQSAHRVSPRGLWVALRLQARREGQRSADERPTTTRPSNPTLLVFCHPPQLHPLEFWELSGARSLGVMPQRTWTSLAMTLGDRVAGTRERLECRPHVAGDVAITKGGASLGPR